jgi:RNA polymerase sigma-70 factor (ECF subfamily)
MDTKNNDRTSEDGRDGDPRQEGTGRENGAPASNGQALEAYRRYLLAVANREIDSGLEPKTAPSDVVQDTYVKAHRDIHNYKGRSAGELKSWLRQILRRTLANSRRRYQKTFMRDAAREVSLDQPSPSSGGTFDIAASGKTPSSIVAGRELAEVVMGALDRLSNRDRELILWRNREQCSFEEIGRRLGGSPETARKAWTRAIERLRDELGDPSWAGS